MHFEYSLASEDTGLELAAMPYGPKSVVAIAGSGSRILPLLSKRPEQLYIIDVSDRQMAITEFRLSALASLDLAQFQQLIGYIDVSRKERRQLFGLLGLSENAERYMRNVFCERDWGPILLEGRWEKSFKTISRLLRTILGSEIDRLFECRSATEQLEFVERTFFARRWKFALHVLAANSAITSITGAYSATRKNIPLSFLQVYEQRFDRLFRQGPARQNFYLNLVFFGHLKYEQARPIEVDPDVYQSARTGLENCRVDTQRNDILATLSNLNNEVDFLSLSNVPSLFSGDLEHDYLQKIRDKIRMNGLVVSRTFLHVPFRLNTAGYENVTADFASAVDSEATQIYFIDMFRKL